MFILPVKRDFPIRHQAWVVYGLILANSLIFLVTWSLLPLQDVVHRFGFTPMNHEAWTVLTSMFLHGGWAHIIGNMLFLWIFGESVEHGLGHGLTLICYLLSGFLGTLLYYLFNATSTVPCIGASGAISGVVGMYAVLFPKAKMDLEFYVGQARVGTLPTNALTAVAAWLAEQSLLEFVVRAGGFNWGIAFLAHVGGLVAGAALSLAIIRLGISPAYRNMFGRKTAQSMTCPGCQATMPRRGAGRYRCSSCRALLRVTEEGDVTALDPAKSKAHWRGLVGLGLGIGSLIIGVTAIINGEFTFSGRRGGEYHLRGRAAIAFGIASISFALLLCLAGWVATRGGTSIRQLSWWEVVLVSLGTVGAVAGVAGMMVFQWDPLIWGFVGGFVILVVIAMAISLAVKK
jgi:membrane associated rhomboid family serine protease